jgi:hypothetical protein
MPKLVEDLFVFLSVGISQSVAFAFGPFNPARGLDLFKGRKSMATTLVT